MTTEFKTCPAVGVECQVCPAEKCQLQGYIPPTYSMGAFVVPAEDDSWDQWKSGRDVA